MVTVLGGIERSPDYWWGLAAAVFFGIGAVVFAILLLPGAAFLKLDSDGLTVCALYRATFTSWDAVEGFGVTQVGLRKFVGVALTEPGKTKSLMARFNTGVIGFDGMLPDTYGMTAADLAVLLNDALALAPGIRRTHAG
jgi:hypothetical protein